MQEHAWWCERAGETGCSISCEGSKGLGLRQGLEWQPAAPKPIEACGGRADVRKPLQIQWPKRFLGRGLQRKACPPP